MSILNFPPSGWLVGDFSPIGVIPGLDNQFYFDRVNNQVYLFTNGAWVLTEISGGGGGDSVELYTLYDDYVPDFNAGNTSVSKLFNTAVGSAVTIVKVLGPTGINPTPIDTVKTTNGWRKITFAILTSYSNHGLGNQDIGLALRTPLSFEETYWPQPREKNSTKFTCEQEVAFDISDYQANYFWGFMANNNTATQLADNGNVTYGGEVRACYGLQVNGSGAGAPVGALEGKLFLRKTDNTGTDSFTFLANLSGPPQLHKIKIEAVFSFSPFPSPPGSFEVELKFYYNDTLIDTTVITSGDLNLLSVTASSPMNFGYATKGRVGIAGIKAIYIDYDSIKREEI